MAIVIKCKDGCEVHVGFDTDMLTSDELKQIMDHLEELKEKGHHDY